VIEATIARIQELGYLDDEGYAARRALIMAEKGYGDFAIRVFLEDLGLDQSYVAKALDALRKDLGERQRLKTMIEKRHDLSRAKLIRFLAGRGFPIDLILDETGGMDA